MRFVFVSKGIWNLLPLESLFYLFIEFCIWHGRQIARVNEYGCGKLRLSNKNLVVRSEFRDSQCCIIFPKAPKRVKCALRFTQIFLFSKQFFLVCVFFWRIRFSLPGWRIFFHPRILRKLRCFFFLERHLSSPRFHWNFVFTIFPFPLLYITLNSTIFCNFKGIMQIKFNSVFWYLKKIISRFLWQLKK